MIDLDSIGKAVESGMGTLAKEFYDDEIPIAVRVVVVTDERIAGFTVGPGGLAGEILNPVLMGIGAMTKYDANRVIETAKVAYKIDLLEREPAFIEGINKALDDIEKKIDEQEAEHV